MAIPTDYLALCYFISQDLERTDAMKFIAYRESFYRTWKMVEIHDVMRILYLAVYARSVPFYILNMPTP